MDDATELHCPTCDYDLRGLPENRCPECGQPFDLVQLRADVSGQPQPILDARGELRSLLSITPQVLFSPAAFARRFPVNHDVTTAICNSLVWYTVFTVPFLILNAARRTEDFMAALPGALAGFWVCETILAALWAIFVPPYRVRRRRYHFWRGLTHFGGVFTLLTMLWLVSLPLLAGPGPLGGTLLLCSAVVIFAWWAVSMCAMVVARGTAGRFAGCAFVPIAGAIGILAGFVVAGFLVVTL